MGCARLGGIFQDDTSGFLNLLSVAREAGINFFDTADMYSQGESEALLGRAFHGVRSRVVIASKVGYLLPQRRMLAARLKPFLRPVIRAFKIRRSRLPSSVRGALAQNFSPGYLGKAVESSLRRLRTDYLDLLQLHSPPTPVIEHGEWEGALQALQRKGMIRYYGIACDSVEAGIAALRHPGVSSIQCTVNLLDRDAVEKLVPVARAKGVAVIARECLANGLLAKRPEEIDLAAYCSSPEQQRHRTEQLTEYRRLAADRGQSLARVAVDFVRDADGVSVALLGARNVKQLQGLLAHVAERRDHSTSVA